MSRAVNGSRCGTIPLHEERSDRGTGMGTWMIEDVTPEMVQNVGRAIQDPMIGGWPLIHWEWVFSNWRAGRGIEVVGAWPDSENRLVTLRYHPEHDTRDHPVLEF